MRISNLFAIGSQHCVYVQYVSNSFQQSVGSGVSAERGPGCCISGGRSSDDEGPAASCGAWLGPLAHEVCQCQYIQILSHVLSYRLMRLSLGGHLKEGRILGIDLAVSVGTWWSIFLHTYLFPSQSFDDIAAISALGPALI